MGRIIVGGFIFITGWVILLGGGFIPGIIVIGTGILTSDSD